MNFQDLATKQDLLAFKEELKSLLVPSINNPNTQQGITSNEIKTLWGGCSVTLINNLRIKGILSAKRAGKVWIYNRQQVMDFIPEYKRK